MQLSNIVIPNKEWQKKWLGVSRWFHWLIVLAAVSVLAAVCGYAYANSVLDGLGYDFESQLSGFSVVNFVIAALLYVVASFSMRWWSSNCRHTPIPE